MTQLISLNESLLTRRKVSFWLVGSNGTTPASAESGNRPQWSLNGSAFTNSTNTLSAVSANAGRYVLDLTQSECSQPGTMVFRHTPTSSFEQGADAIVQFVANNPYVNTWDEPRSSHTDLSSFGWANQVVSGRTLQGGTTSTLTLNSAETTRDDIHNGAFILVQYADLNFTGAYISDYTGSSREAAIDRTLPVAAASGMSYVLFGGSPAQDVAGLVWNAARSAYSTSGSFGQYVNSQQTGSSTGTIQGVSNTANFPTSGGSTGDDIANSVWSSYNTRTLKGTSSDATLIRVTNVVNVSNATLAAGFHSGATISGVSNTANFPSVSVNTLQVADAVWASYLTRTLKGNSSDATIFGVQSVFSVQNIAPTARLSLASSYLSADMGSGRLVEQAFHLLRNKVDVGTSVMTIYGPDDATSSWTATPTAGGTPLSGVDPAGP